MPVVATTGGLVEGSTDGDLYRFRGIPYAAAPVGALRFGPPEPVAPWIGTRPAIEFGPISLQGPTPFMDWLGAPKVAQGEDCLSVNVWTPGTDDALRPVMVWIHGGGFVGGSGALPFADGGNLARRGEVVVVSLNYRLGALGFLHLAELDPTLSSSGLNGILDQVAALAWVRDNIEGFGGDPTNVTIFGSSAGGMSVATLLTLPAARGLFHRAIAQSGAASHAIDAEAAAERTWRFCALANYGTVEQIRSVDAKTLLEAQAGLRKELAHKPMDRAGTGSITSFQPVIDGHHLDAAPIVLAERGDIAPVPVMTGTNEDEWSFFSVAGPGPGSDGELAELLVDALGDPAAGIRTYRDRLGSDAPVKAVHDAMMTDRVFRAPMQRLADASVRAGNPTYVYRFAHRTPVMDGALGACHSLEVPFVFDNRDGAVELFVGPGSPDPLAQAVQAAWASFARHGDPNHDGLPRWEPQQRDRRPVLRFDEPIEATEDPEHAELAVWYGTG